MTLEASYNIYEITNKQTWDDFVTSQPHHTFLHSWAWGEFNEAMGDKIWRFGIYSNSTGSDPVELLAAAFVVKVHAKRGNFLFVPQGPLLRQGYGGQAVLEILVKQLKKLAGQEKVSFVRISSLLTDTEENRNLFKQLGLRPAPIHMHAEMTWTLDLTPSEDDLLRGMRKTTRNLIRRAQREGVKIKTGTDEGDVDIFYSLYRETFKKHHFTPFSLAYIENQVKILANGSPPYEGGARGGSDARVFTAWHNNIPIASAIIVFYGNSAFYHHGASIPSKIPAAYLLQWEAILEAKRRGHKFYNFWGITKADAPANHPWQGITLFKKGFGGFKTNYLHAQDLPLSPMYWVNWAIEAVRKKKRNL